MVKKVLTGAQRALIDVEGNIRRTRNSINNSLILSEENVRLRDQYPNYPQVVENTTRNIAKGKKLRKVLRKRLFGYLAMRDMLVEKIAKESLEDSES